MSVQHVVWDWNGTLLDDLEVVLGAVNVAMATLDGPPVDGDIYRTHFTRPIQHFYEGLLGRSISESEWHLLNDTYHEAYYSQVHDAPLAFDALDALARVDGLGWNQSLLSMTPQARLEWVVADHGLFDRLQPVTGLPGQTGGLKAEHMELHLDRQNLVGPQVAVIGDTPDDVTAARAVGAVAILYDSGSHHREQLDEVGVPVVNSLVEAIETALSL